MAIVEIQLRRMPKTGGGRVMIWLQSMAGVIPIDSETFDGWRVLKIGDMRLWPDEVPLPTDAVPVTVGGWR